jgi:neutral ceramidase
MKLLLLALALACAPLTSHGQSSLRAGAAQVVITPPNGAPMAGYYHARGAEGTLDDLFSKALVLDDGATKVAFVTLDLITTTFALTRQARVEIERLTGIPAGNVMISATHAHTGPELAERGSRSALLGEGSNATNSITATYSQGLPKLIAESVRQAAARLTNVQASAAMGRCDGLAFNRRYYMKDGSVGWNPGKLNPDISSPAGATDPEVNAVFFEPAHKPAQLVAAHAVYINFAMHPDTIGGALFSADYPGALSRRMAEYHGTNCVTLFANGTCGNINHTDVNWARQQSTRAEADRIGTILAASVFLSEKNLREIKPMPLRAKSEIVQLPVAPITPEEADEARVTVRVGNDKTRDNFMKLVKAYQVLDVAAREGKPWEVEVQVISIGNELAWVGLPGEIFAELGLAIKKRSPFPQTLIAELSNGSIGYVPDRRSYAEGNYEAVSARPAAGSGEKLAEVATRLLKSIYEESPVGRIP